MKTKKEFWKLFFYITLFCTSGGTIVSIFFIEDYPLVFAFCVFSLIFSVIFLIALDNEDKMQPPEPTQSQEKPQEPPKAQEPITEPQIDIQYAREHCYESVEMYQAYWYNRSVIKAKEQIRDYLQSEESKITKLLLTRQIDKAMERIQENLCNADPIRDANAIHWYLISALRDFYAIREEDQIIYSCCLQICDYDIDNLENFFKVHGVMPDQPYDENGIPVEDAPAQLRYFRDPPPILETVTKKAIILERLGYLDEAIAFCDYAIEHDLPDTGGNSFLARKMRLEKKKAKAEKSIHY